MYPYIFGEAIWMHSLYNIIIYTCTRYVNLTVHPSYTGTHKCKTHKCKTHKCKRIWSRRTGTIRHFQNLEFCVLPIKLLRLIKNGGHEFILDTLLLRVIIDTIIEYL